MSIPDLSLAGKVAIVTGSRRGIGRAYALAFAGAGADVAVCDYAFEGGEMEAVAGEIRALGRRAITVQADITHLADVENLVQSTVTGLGGIDILVNNAGVVFFKPLIDTTEDEWDKTINVHLRGCYLCSQAVARRMIDQKRGGSIINIASHYAFKAALQGVYCVAKAGVVMLTRVLARELGGYGIRANAIAPGLTRTDANKQRFADPEFIKQRVSQMPLGRPAEPYDMVGTALFLASDASSYISGQTIVVDGGGLA